MHEALTASDCPAHVSSSWLVDAARGSRVDNIQGCYLNPQSQKICPSPMGCQQSPVRASLVVPTVSRWSVYLQAQMVNSNGNRNAEIIII